MNLLLLLCEYIADDMTCNNAMHPIHESTQITLYNNVYHIKYIKFISYPIHESTKYASNIPIDIT